MKLLAGLSITQRRHLQWEQVWGQLRRGGEAALLRAQRACGSVDVQVCVFAYVIKRNMEYFPTPGSRSQGKDMSQIVSSRVIPGNTSRALGKRDREEREAATECVMGWVPLWATGLQSYQGCLGDSGELTAQNCPH